MAEPGPAGQMEEQEENVQAVQTGTMGRLQRSCKSVQGGGQESQGSAWPNFGKGYQEEQERLLQVPHPEKESPGMHTMPSK